MSSEEVTLNIRVPYQDPSGKEKFKNLCWASIVAALHSYYCGVVSGVENVVRTIFDGSLVDEEYDLDEALEHPKYNYKYDYYNIGTGEDECGEFKDQETAIIDSIDRKKPVVLQLKKKNGVQHFIIILGYSRKGSNITYTIGDPSGRFDTKLGNLTNGEYTLLKSKNKTYESMQIVGIAFFHDDNECVIGGGRKNIKSRRNINKQVKQWWN